VSAAEATDTHRQRERERENCGEVHLCFAAAHAPPLAHALRSGVSRARVF
jgi:hypothetical protein